jgi:hypothetical protein
VFIDDILVYSKTFEEHSIYLKQVLQLLDQHQLSVKNSKWICKYVISVQGMATYPKNIDAIQK